jgi:GNAT superfamily N-acetyltransferase
VTVVLRTGVPADFAQVGPLHYRSRRTAYAGFLPPEALTFGSPDALREWWTERWSWERDTHRFVVAADGDRIVGFSYLGPSEEPGAVELAAIHVEPDRVGTGVGRLLMADALPHLGDHGVLWVLEQNERARRFYERGGWRPDGSAREAPIGAVITRQVRYSWIRSLGGGSA